MDTPRPLPPGPLRGRTRVIVASALLAWALAVAGPAHAQVPGPDSRTGTPVPTITVLAQPQLSTPVMRTVARARAAGIVPVSIVSVEPSGGPDIAVTRGGLRGAGAYARKSGRWPFVPVAHFACPVGSIPTSYLKAAFLGRGVLWSSFGGPRRRVVPVVAGAGGKPDPLAVEALGLSSMRGVRVVSSAADAVALAARTPGVVALVPLGAVDVRVRTLSVSGQHGVRLGGQPPYPVAASVVVERPAAPTSTERATSKGRREPLVAALYRRLAADLVPAAPTKRLNIAAVGDIMLSRKVLRAMLAARDWELPFRRTASVLRRADLTWGNLESPFSDRGGYVLSGMSFKAQPPSIRGLNLAGFDAVSLANNHFGNQGRYGMHYTYRHLDANRIAYFGAGRDYREAHTARVVRRRDVRVAFLSYNEIWPYDYTAGARLAGHAWMQSPRTIAADIRAARRRADVVIVSYHWGIEYTPHPTSRQRYYARVAVDAGADAVLSQHPHVVQAVQWRRGRFIAYSLGNFVFDQMWSQETREGLIAHVDVLDGRIVSVSFTPTVIQNYNQPRRASRSESARILGRVWRASGVARW